LKSEKRVGVIRAVKKDCGKRVVNNKGKRWPMELGLKVFKRIRMRNPSIKAREKAKIN